jgi:hypothetical protein
MKNMQKRAPKNSHFRVLGLPPAGNPAGGPQVTRDPGAIRGYCRNRRDSSE